DGEEVGAAPGIQRVEESASSTAGQRRKPHPSRHRSYRVSCQLSLARCADATDNGRRTTGEMDKAGRLSPPSLGRALSRGRAGGGGRAGACGRQPRWYRGHPVLEQLAQGRFCFDITSPLSVVRITTDNGQPTTDSGGRQWMPKCFDNAISTSFTS